MFRVRLAIFATLLSIGANQVLACAVCGCSLSSDAVTGYSTEPGWSIGVQYDYINQDQLRVGKGYGFAARSAPPPGVSSPTTSHRNRTCEVPGKRCRYVSHADPVARPADSSRKRPRHAEYCHDNTSMPSPPDTPCASPQSSCSQQAGHLPGGRLPEIPSFQLPWPLPSPTPTISQSTKSIGHNGMKNRRDHLSALPVRSADALFWVPSDAWEPRS